MFVLTLNLNTSVTPWHTSHTNGTNFITRENGGDEFYAMVNSLYASKEYLVKPDYTWELVEGCSDSTEPAIGSEYFTSKGIFEHECGGNEDVHESHQVQSNVTLDLNIEHNSLEIDVFNNDLYSIALYSVSGKKVYSIPQRQLSEGVQSIPLREKSLSKGIYFAEVKWSTGIIKKRIVIK